MTLSDVNLAQLRTCLVMPPPAGQEAGFDQTDLGYLQYFLSRFVPGQSLTLLVTGEVDCPRYAEILKDYLGAEITVLKMEDLPPGPRLLGNSLNGGTPYILDSLRIYHYLKGADYEAVVFNDAQAPGFLSIRAKRTGLAFPRTKLVTFLNQCHKLQRYRTCQWPKDPVYDAKLDFAEKYCCEFADVFIVQDRAIYDWAKAQGWNLKSEKMWLLENLAPGKMGFHSPSGPKTPRGLAPAARNLDDAPAPLVSICIPHYNHGHYLPKLLFSIAKNNYPNFEVIVVDDGSTEAQSLITFREMQEKYPEPKWRFLKEDTNHGPGKARNLAVWAAAGDYLIFMDADNLAQSHMISDFIEGMLHSQADCLTCWFAVFSEERSADATPKWLYTYAPLGPCLEAGLFENVFGDTNFCIKRTVFEALGGFPEEPGVSWVDWRLLAKLAVRGFLLEVIPKRLFHYRHRQDSFGRRQWSPNNFRHIQAAYLQDAPTYMQEILSNLTLPLLFKTSEGREEGRLFHWARAIYRQLDAHQKIFRLAKLAGKSFDYLSQGQFDLFLQSALNLLRRRYQARRWAKELGVTPKQERFKAAPPLKAKAIQMFTAGDKDLPVVFVFQPYLAVGGVERLTLDIIKEVKRQFAFVSINFEPLDPAKGNLRHLYAEHTLGIYNLPEMGPQESFLPLLKSLKERYRPSLIWITNGSNWLADHALEVRELFADIPIVDQQVYDTEAGWIGRYHEPGIQSFDRFIAVNHKIYSVFIHRFHLAPQSIDLIYSPIDEERFHLENWSQKKRRQTLQQLHLPEDRPIFGWLARVNHQKDPLALVKLALNMRMIKDDSFFLMVGSGPLAPEVTKAIEANALENIKLHGFHPDPSQILPLFAGLIITSKFEGFPLVLAEALAMGVPVFSTDVGLSRVCCEHYRSGLVVPFSASDKAFSECFKIWKDELPMFQQGAKACAELIRKRFARAEVAALCVESWNKASLARGGKLLV